MAVSVKVTVPVSPDPGLYVGVKVLALKIVPVPVCVHRIELKFDALAGVVCVVKLILVPWQVSASLPAFTNGAVLIVKVIWLLRLGQLPLPFAVSVNVTVPVSPAPGV